MKISYTLMVHGECINGMLNAKLLDKTSICNCYQKAL